MGVTGYLRVSTAAQATEKNKAAVIVFSHERGLGVPVFVEEVVSGKKPWREREIAGVIDGLAAGDVLVVPELSRLGRSMLEIMEILQIALERGAVVYAVKGPWVLDGSLQSKIVAMVMAMAAEIERDLIADRTKEALEDRKRRSDAGEEWVSKSGRTCRKLGRPAGPGKSKLDAHKNDIQDMLAHGATQAWVARHFKTSQQNLANWMAKHNIQRPKD